MLHDHQLLSQIVVHGFLLWASMGFLMPVGILAIRLSNLEEHGRKRKIMFFVHAVTQASFHTNCCIIQSFIFR